LVADVAPLFSTGPLALRGQASATFSLEIRLKSRKTPSSDFASLLIASKDGSSNQIVTFLQTLTDGFTTPYPDINTFTRSVHDRR